MRRLLVSQLEVADLLDPALRTNAVFLGEVNLSKSKSAIAADATEDIEAVGSWLHPLGTWR